MVGLCDAEFIYKLDRMDTDRDGWIQISYEQFMNVSSGLMYTKQRFDRVLFKNRSFLVLLDSYVI